MNRKMEEVFNTVLSGCFKSVIELYREKIIENNISNFIFSYADIRLIEICVKSDLPLDDKCLSRLIERKDVSEEKKIALFSSLDNSLFNQDKLLAKSIKQSWNMFDKLCTLLTPGDKTFFNLAYHGGKEKVEEYVAKWSLNPTSIFLSPALWLGAIKRKEKELYDTLFALSIPLLSKVMTYALEEGEIELVYQLREKDCPWNSEFTNVAAAKNNLEVLEWAVKNGCPINEDATYYARESGSIKVLYWLIDN